MIRNATHADIPRIVALGRRAFEISHWAGRTTFNPELVAASVETFIDRPDIGVFVSPQGVLIVVVVPLFFSGEPTTQELYFWVFDGQGLALRKAAEAWAADKGTLAVVMGSHEPGRTEAIANWYRRGGYVPHGHTFIKVFAHGD